MWDCTDSQEVGLEAATLQRVRNSSLVEWSCAENVTGLKRSTEATDACESRRGRRAFLQRRSTTGRTCGAGGSENAGMSSVQYVRTVLAVNLRFPTEGQ